MRVRLPLLVAAAVAVVGTVSGCGTGADRDQVRAVTVRFLAALAARQGDAACAQLSTALRTTLMQGERHGQRCAGAVVKLTTGGGSPRAVRVYATSARVDLSGGESVFLGQMRHGWRIEALGCRPRPSGLYACEQRA